MGHRKNYRLKFIILIMFIFPLAVSVKTYGEIKELSGDVEVDTLNGGLSVDRK